MIFQTRQNYRDTNQIWTDNQDKLKCREKIFEVEMFPLLS